MIAALLGLVLASVPAIGRSAEGPVRRVALRELESRGCAGVAHVRDDRELHIRGERAVDPAARFWQLDRPRSYARNRAVVRYRIDDGALLVESELAGDLRTETVRIREAEPVDPRHLQIYLPGVDLPCERVVRYEPSELPATTGDLDPIARVDALLHEAAELEYDRRFDEARRLLQRAARLDPADPAPRWMMARALYLEIEQAVPEPSTGERIETYRKAEEWADRAVELAPGRPEGYLWQGITRGRMATASGSVRAAISGVLGGRGPAWLEATLHKAVSLPAEYEFFGFSTRGNALHALAQFYRLAPDAWYMAALGTRGDIDRAIELSREAVELQPVRIEFRKELAVELLCRGRDGDRSEARRQLAALLELPATTAIDRIDQAHARRLRAGSITRVCAYSRDAEPETLAWAR